MVWMPPKRWQQENIDFRICIVCVKRPDRRRVYKSEACFCFSATVVRRSDTHESAINKKQNSTLL